MLGIEHAATAARRAESLRYGQTASQQPPTTQVRPAHLRHFQNFQPPTNEQRVQQIPNQQSRQQDQPSQQRRGQTGEDLCADGEDVAKDDRNDCKEHAFPMDEWNPRDWDNIEYEYLEECGGFMLLVEQNTQPVPAHMDVQPEVKWDMRPILLDFLVQAHFQCGLKPETFFLTLNIMDRYLSKRIVYKKHYQLLGVTSLWIASKYEDVKDNVPVVADLWSMCSKCYPEADFVHMERHIMRTLNYEMGFPTQETWIKYLLVSERYKAGQITTTTTTAAAGEDDKMGEVKGFVEMDLKDRKKVQDVARMILEIACYHRWFVACASSLLAKSALFSARYILGLSPSAQGLTRETVQCIQNLDRSLATATSAVLTKYAHERYSQASLVIKSYLSSRSPRLTPPWSEPQSALGRIASSRRMWVPAGLSRIWHQDPSFTRDYQNEQLRLQEQQQQIRAQKQQQQQQQQHHATFCGLNSRLSKQMPPTPICGPPTPVTPSMLVEPPSMLVEPPSYQDPHWQQQQYRLTQQMYAGQQQQQYNRHPNQMSQIPQPPAPTHYQQQPSRCCPLDLVNGGYSVSGYPKDIDAYGTLPPTLPPLPPVPHIPNHLHQYHHQHQQYQQQQQHPSSKPHPVQQRYHNPKHLHIQIPQNYASGTGIVAGCLPTNKDLLSTTAAATMMMMTADPSLPSPAASIHSQPSPPFSSLSISSTDLSASTTYVPVTATGPYMHPSNVADHREMHSMQLPSASMPPLCSTVSSASCSTQMSNASAVYFAPTSERSSMTLTGSSEMSAPDSAIGTGDEKGIYGATTAAAGAGKIEGDAASMMMEGDPKNSRSRHQPATSAFEKPRGLTRIVKHYVGRVWTTEEPYSVMAD